MANLLNLVVPRNSSASKAGINNFVLEIPYIDPKFVPTLHHRMKEYIIIRD